MDLLGTASVQADKVVNVRLSESEHTLLKTYCASLNRSMQDVLRDFALMQIQKQHFCCRLVRSLMEEHGIEQDLRVSKPVTAMPVTTAATQMPVWLVRRICFISPARRYVNSLLRNRLISSSSTAPASRPLRSRADRVSTRQ